MGTLGKLFSGLVQQSRRAARSVERSVQEVVEVLQPGALGSSAARWDHQRRSEADQAVQQALGNWQALEQQGELHTQQQQQAQDDPAAPVPPSQKHQQT